MSHGQRPRDGPFQSCLTGLETPVADARLLLAVLLFEGVNQRFPIGKPSGSRLHHDAGFLHGGACLSVRNFRLPDPLENRLGKVDILSQVQLSVGAAKSMDFHYPPVTRIRYETRRRRWARKSGHDEPMHLSRSNF